MEFRGLKQLRELDPVVDIVEAMGFVLGVYPEARGLVAAACAPLA
jgi:hypothetical protein